MESGTVVYLDGGQLQQLIDEISALRTYADALGLAFVTYAAIVLFAVLSYGFWRYIFKDGGDA